MKDLYLSLLCESEKDVVAMLHTPRLPTLANTYATFVETKLMEVIIHILSTIKYQEAENGKRLRFNPPHLFQMFSD